MSRAWSYGIKAAMATALQRREAPVILLHPDRRGASDPDGKPARYAARLEVSDPPEQTDGELVRLARAGESAAIEMLYRRHAPSLLALATHLLGQRAEADDALHDAFLRALERLSALRIPERFAPWLRRIVVNECRARLRRRSRLRLFPRGSAPDELFDTMASRTPSAEHAAELRRLGVLVAGLAPDERVAWSLRFVEGCSAQEGAALVGCSLATFKRRLARASRRVGRLAMESDHV